MSRADSYLLDCEDAAAMLEAMCQPTLAHSIRGLIRSYKASRVVNSQLFADNTRLRGREPPAVRTMEQERRDKRKPLSAAAKAATSSLLEPVAARAAAGRIWCDQCQARVSPQEGRSCTRRFCGMKPAELVYG
jgi:hypothetical protein